MEEHYTFSEILFGLYQEYKNNYQYLEQLKKYCTKDEKKVLDFKFSILFDQRLESPWLYCIYDPNFNRVKKMIEFLAQRTGRYIYGSHTSLLITDDDQSHFKHEDFPVQITSLKEFDELSKLILQSLFANNITTERPIGIHNESLDGTFTINASKITLTFRNKENHLTNTWAMYSPRNATLKIGSGARFLTEQSIEDILSIPIPKDKLNPYHVNIIDAAKKKDDFTLLGCQDLKDNVELEVSEEEKGFVLRKKRNR